MINFIQNNIEFFIFIIFLSIFLYLKRSKVEFQGSPLLYMLLYKTTWGLKQMKSWSKQFPKTFLYLAYFCYFIGVVGMVAVLILTIWSLGFVLENNLSAGGGLVLPIQTENGLESTVPVFYVPFWYWIIALFILATVHEFAHGVIAQRFGVKIKSSGFAFLGILAPILPAAFVEPDEEQMKKKPKWQQISILGAGSASNFIFAFLFFLIMIFIGTPIVNSTMQIDSISFSSILNESSFNEYNISSGTIKSVNGIENKEEILNSFSNLEINETLDITLDDNNTYQITTFEHNQDNSRGMVGISGLETTYGNVEGYEFLGDLPVLFERLLFYIFFLNFGIGLMNLLPLWITDGGKIFHILMSYKFKEKSALRIYNLVSWFCLILIIFSVKPSLLISLVNLF